MKPIKKHLGGLFFIGALVALAGFIQAQVASTPAQDGTASLTTTSINWSTASDREVMIAAVELTTPQPATNSPECGNFYTVQHAEDWPPLPANFYGLPFWDLGGGFYLLDDRDFDYEALAQEIQALHAMAVAMGLEADNEEMGSSFMIDTNGLWLEITNVADGLAYLNLHNGTDYVYEVWSKTDLSAANWNIETEVFPGTNQDVMPFTVSQMDRTNLFIWARDWTGITSGGNTVPEWWFWKYFRTVDLSDTNLDSHGNSLLYDYTNNLDPNIVSFSLQFTNQYINSSPVNGSITILSGVPAYKAGLINDTNLADAIWQPFSTNLSVSLNSGDGDYGVQIGLRGFPQDAQPTWVNARLTLDTIPPTVIVTNPAEVVVSQPMIQVQGLVNEELSRLTFDVSNAAGVFTDQTGYTSEWLYDTNLLMFTTNSFQCYDVALTNGLNTITLRATDLAGNTTTTSFDVTLDYSGDTNTPELSIVWPQEGAAIAGSNFALEAQIDDLTAKVTACISGQTNTGTIQRDGTVKVENLPLTAGTNTMAVTATDAAGNSFTTNFTVVESAVTLTLDPLSGGQMNQPSVNVTGTVSDASDNVTVNGVAATVNSDGTWSADSVPVNTTGAANFQIEVTDAASNPLAWQHFDQPQPAAVVLSSYLESNHSTGSSSYPWDDHYTAHWVNGIGGGWTDWGFDTGNEPPYEVVHYHWSDDFPSDAPPAQAGPPWENARLNFVDDSVAAEYSVESKLLIVPKLQAIGGTAELYLVRIKALAYSNPFDLGWWNTADVPVEPEGLQVNGQTLVNSGVTNDDGGVWGQTLLSGPPGAPVVLTLTTKQIQNGQRYDFESQVTNVTLQIIDANTGQNLTTQTNTVIVGQQMNLTCQLSLTNQDVVTNFPLANFQWTVPGNIFTDYVATAQSATLCTNLLTTQSNVVFYWANDGLMRVQCSATMNGKSVTGQAWFMVIRPEVTWTLTPKDSVAVDTNYYWGDYHDTLLAGYDYLRTGQNRTLNDMGMVFEFHVTDMKGYTGNCQLQFYQIATIDWRKNVEIYGTRFSESVSGRGYDRTLPVTWWSYSNTNGNAADTPAHTLTGEITFLWRSDSFESYLMFMPAGGKPVPLKLATWNWYGRAQRMDTNTPPTFVGVTPFTNPQAATGTDCFVHPTWTNNIENIKNDNWQTHVTEYPTP